MQSQGRLLSERRDSLWVTPRGIRRKPTAEYYGDNSVSVDSESRFEQVSYRIGRLGSCRHAGKESLIPGLGSRFETVPQRQRAAEYRMVGMLVILSNTLCLEIQRL